MKASEKPKIVHIIPTLGLGGAGKILVSELRHADRDKFDFAVIALESGGPLENEIRSFAVPLYQLKKTTELGLGMLVELTALLNRLKPDIVHTHLFQSDWWSKAASLLNRVPIVICSEQTTETGGEFQHRVKQMLSFAADTYVVPYEAGRQYMLQEERIDEEKIVVIKNGIETDRFTNLQPAKFTAPFKIVSIGRLEPHKGHDVLFDALSGLQEIAWDLTLVGEGSVYDDLADRATLLRIQDRVKFAGAVFDIAPILETADIVVMPSRWEGLGLSIMEAMAAGRTVIATSVGGTPELITHLRTGVLVPPDDPHALVKAMRGALEQEQNSRRMAAAARVYAKEFFSARDMVRSYELLYTHLLSRQ